MRYLLVAILLLGLGVFIGTRWNQAPQPTDPLTVIVTQLKTQAIIKHERRSPSGTRPALKSSASTRRC